MGDTDPRILDPLRQRLRPTGDASIGTLAVARGWLSQEQLRQGLREAKKIGAPLAQVLVQKNLLTPAQLQELVLAK